MMNIPTHREPSHPGEILREEYLIPLGITQATLAKDLEIPYQRINEILNKKRGITPSTALRLASYFKTTPDFWMNLQMRLDMYHAMKKEGKLLDRIQARVSS
ncbi:MAG: HigA family addiction module antidote protein [Saprospiraceae bacterium]|nr:HigA family addiction module antidote protein [Candidatus Opimibacter skivensis]